MGIRQPSGMSMEKWALTKGVVMVGWVAFLRVAEMVRSGMEKGQPKEGPSGRRLDVCDAVFVAEARGRVRLDLRVRSANVMDGNGTSEVGDPTPHTPH